MIQFARIPVMLALAALLLGGCQTSRDRFPFSREQRAALLAEGFVAKDRGWEFSMTDRLLFDSDEDKVKREQAVVISRIARRLLAVGLQHAAVEGHADDSGSDAYNDQLSRRRADAVAAALAAGGFAPGNLTALGVGKRYPIDGDRSVGARAQNRRVVILITAP